MAALPGNLFHVNASFDPWTQDFTFLAPDGKTPLQASMTDIMVLQHNATTQCISQGIETGAAFMLAIVLLMVTSRDKRRSSVFFINFAALIMVVVRGILSIIALTGPFYDFYRWATMYYADLHSAKNITATGEFSAFLLVTLVEISLAIQVSIICCNLATLQRLAINATNIFTAFVVCTLRFTLMIVNIAWGIMDVENESLVQFTTIGKLASATSIALVVSIGISSLLFSAKLGFAIRARRSMGMNQFGPMQIIFVMGCQTMLTPFIFTVVAFWGIRDAQLSSVVPTVVALSLPLSAMWATANTNNRHAAVPSSRQNLPIGASGHTGRGGKSSFYTDTEKSGTLVDDSPVKVGFEDREKDLESGGGGHGMGELGRGVRVERAYSVRAE